MSICKTLSISGLFGLEAGGGCGQPRREYERGSISCLQSAKTISDGEVSKESYAFDHNYIFILSSNPNESTYYTND